MAVVFRNPCDEVSLMKLGTKSRGFKVKVGGTRPPKPLIIVSYWRESGVMHAPSLWVHQIPDSTKWRSEYVPLCNKKILHPYGLMDLKAVMRFKKGGTSAFSQSRGYKKTRNVLWNPRQCKRCERIEKGTYGFARDKMRDMPEEETEAV